MTGPEHPFPGLIYGYRTKVMLCSQKLLWSGNFQSQYKGDLVEGADVKRWC